MDLSPVTRALPFSTMFNFRDVGGYLGYDGHAVRWNRLYRSDSLHRLDGTDREAFAALGLRTVIDLRRPREVSRDGRVPDFADLAYRHIHLEHRPWEEFPYDESLGLARYLAARYLDLAETGAAGIATALGLIADAEAAPVVVHCVAGKDRTGVVCALALSLLGVPDVDIAADYALSAAASDRFAAWLRERRPNAAPLPAHYLASPAEAMLLFLRELRGRHGSAEAYALAAGLTADHVTALRTHLLE